MTLKPKNPFPADLLTPMRAPDVPLGDLFLQDWDALIEKKEQAFRRERNRRIGLLFDHYGVTRGNLELLCIMMIEDLFPGLKMLPADHGRRATDWTDIEYLRLVAGVLMEKQRCGKSYNHAIGVYHRKHPELKMDEKSLRDRFHKGRKVENNGYMVLVDRTGDETERDRRIVQLWEVIKEDEDVTTPSGGDPEIKR